METRTERGGRLFRLSLPAVGRHLAERGTLAQVGKLTS